MPAGYKGVSLIIVTLNIRGEWMPYPLGSMLQRPIKVKKINLAHHLGIYVGDNKVIHFGYPSETIINKTDLNTFSDEQKITVKQYPADENHAERVCKVAKILLETPNNNYNEKYNILLNNCEDFVRECYGKNSYLIMDQWENIRGNIGQTTTKTSGHIFNEIGAAARQLGTSQVAKNALGKSAGVSARASIKATVKAAHNTQVGKKAIETIAKNAVGKNIYGGAAINNVSKLARGNAVVGTVTTVVLTGPDIYRAMFDKSVSWKQVSKNLVSNGAMVAGGIGGWAGGAALGTAIFPGVGTIIGGLAGSIAAGTLAERASKATMDLIHEDDSKLMFSLVQKELIKLCEEFQFTEKQFLDDLMPKVTDKMDTKWLREMYRSGTTNSKRSQFAYAQCKGICSEITSDLQ